MTSQDAQQRHREMEAGQCGGNIEMGTWSVGHKEVLSSTASKDELIVCPDHSDDLHVDSCLRDHATLH